MSKKPYITLFDTSLRDGAQTPGLDFSLADKITIARLLDDFGLDYIEGGYPGANPTDTEFFSTSRTQDSVFTAFGMTHRSGISPSNDPGLASLISSSASAICFVAKSSEDHVRIALEISNEENLATISASVKAAIASGKEALVDCEHFFDGYKSNPSYALSCAQAAIDSGARWVVLCDTNGGSQPSEVRRIVEEVCTTIAGENVGIHAHDDTGQAVANSLAALEGGARQIQGTINGIGERCGNANLITLIGTLSLKPYYSDRFAIGISAEKLLGLTSLSRTFDELLNRAPSLNSPYVGTASFATKAGIHASALIKDPTTYEHIAPDRVGNERQLMVSDQGGKSNFLNQLSRHGFDISKSDPKLDRLISDVKEKESLGYSFEAAPASFALLARSILEGERTFFSVESFRVDVERRFNALGEVVSVSQAIVKLLIDGEEINSVAEGNGPVNALDQALRKNLGRYQSHISDLELVDYKVRILNGGTRAITRVLIESVDASGERWSTIGVSQNIIDASFQALIDSLNYKLLKEVDIG